MPEKEPKRRKGKKKPEVRGSRRFSNRALLGISLALFIPGLYIGTSIIDRPSTGEQPTSRSTPLLASSQSEAMQANDQSIIQKAALQLGAQPNQKEMNLWSGAYIQSDQKILPTKENLTEGENRLEQVLQLMYQSENPHFNKASEDFLNYYHKGDMIISMQSVISKQGAEGEGFAGIAAIVKGGKFYYQVGLSLNAVLNKLDPIQFALLITHEVDHLRRAVEFQASLAPSTSAQEKVRRYGERQTIIDVITKDEALAYGLEAQAYIYQFGLGYKRPYGNAHNMVLSFVHLGMDRDNQVWHGYVKDKLLREKLY